MPGRILVIEGDANVRDLIVGGLTEEGYEVLSVATGEEGVILAADRGVDFICLEVELEGIDGFETVTRFRANAATRSTPFIFVTSRAGLQDRVEGLRMGAQAYITKPFAFGELYATLEGLLQRAPDPEPAVPGVVAPAALGLMGSLGAMSITSVIQALEGEAQTGTLNVVSGTRWGRLTFNAGKIVEAASNQSRGEEAIYELFAWTSGTYAFRAQPVEATEPLAESAMSVLMRAAQHHDEKRTVT